MMGAPVMCRIRYDVVYYWSAAPYGVYSWHAAVPGVWPEYRTVDQLVEDLERAGYPARRGLLSIGPPEGMP